MTTKNDEHARIFIAGGYGLIGSNIAHHIRKIHANVELTLAGRNPDKADSLANELGKTETVFLDLDKAVNAEDLTGHDLIIAALQDQAEKLTEIAIDREIAYIGFSRLANEVAPLTFAALKQKPKRPVVLSG